MAGEPTFDELAGMTTLGEVAAWAELEGDGTDVTTPFGSFCDLLGASGTTMPRRLRSRYGGVVDLGYTAEPGPARRR